MKNRVQSSGFRVQDSGFGVQGSEGRAPRGGEGEKGRRGDAASRRGFTLVELLVVIAIIAILTSMVFGVYKAAQATAKEAATKATITKLHNIIMKRYESYLTRRVPISTAGLTPYQAAQDRLYAIRDIMRMEMPDRQFDIPTDAGTGGTATYDAPIVLPNSKLSVPIPALGRLYYNRITSKPPTGDGQNAAAEFLYMIVSMGSPEAMEQFSQAEIGDTDGNGYPEFLDGWGRPIFFLRWAPGFTPYSNTQQKDATDPQVHFHDPFDSRGVDADAYQLIPLIYSGGSIDDPGLLTESSASGKNYHYGDPKNPGGMFSGPTGYDSSTFLQIGTPSGNNGKGNITNHNIEMR